MVDGDSRVSTRIIDKPGCPAVKIASSNTSKPLVRLILNSSSAALPSSCTAVGAAWDLQTPGASAYRIRAPMSPGEKTLKSQRWRKHSAYASGSLLGVGQHFSISGGSFDQSFIAATFC